MTEIEIRQDERAKCVDRLVERHALEGLQDTMRSHYAGILEPKVEHAPAWSGEQPAEDSTTEQENR